MKVVKYIAFCYIQMMLVLGKNVIDKFKRKHPTSRKALDRWVRLVEGADFRVPQDIKQVFGSNVDFVGGQTVFDVGGNKVRAITKVSFGVKILLVTHVLSHSDYDKNKWKE